MQGTTLLTLMVLASLVAYKLGVKKALNVVDGDIKHLHSLPGYYGYFAAICSFLPAFLIYAIWISVEDTVLFNILLSGLPESLAAAGADNIGLLINDIKNIVSQSLLAKDSSEDLKAAASQYVHLHQTSRTILGALLLIVTAVGFVLAYKSIHAKKRARNIVESFVSFFLIACSCIAILTTVGIVLSVMFESIRFFSLVPITEFLFGTDWSPQTALRADQVGSSGAFGILPLFAGTLLISAIAMVVAVPIGLMAAIYLSEYASRRFRTVAKPLLEILAGIPTVVYGFFAALTVAPAFREWGEFLGLGVASESALAAGIVMGIMIIPFVSSLSDDVINAVPQAMRDGALALGATHSETIKRVVFPAALPGIVGGILLAVSRAIGETMIVVMAAGLAANLTANPLEAVTTITVQIVTLLTGDQEFETAKTLSAFALGLMLFSVTLVLNFIALHIVQKYREELEV